MKTALLSLAFGLSLCVFTGCGGDSTSNIIDDASQEDLDNYDRLLQEAESDLAAEDPGDLKE